MLKDVPLAPGFSIRTLAEQADGLSGSDLKELCRNAAMRPMREFLREAGGDLEKLEQSQKEGFTLRPVTLDDFFKLDGSSALPNE
ncbi:hypothetical protein NUW54_g12863 [Trametes sanguinea]|uniref:Uncharacterized protein n=1 Tax=Trametes sanguinea TaxID=158606 RepID=A0ACC1MTC6_9APHY|nr:hypothetical protein NUW54_g12863 [Trametes sanguinea]